MRSMIPSGAILSFSNCLFAFFFFFILPRGNFRLLVTFGSLKLPTEIGITFSFDNFRVMVVQFSFKKKNLVSSKEPSNGYWHSELLLVKLVHLFRNVHEKGRSF